MSKRYSPADLETVDRAINLEALPEGWRCHLRERLQRLTP